jgi:hypothetical protein
MAIDTLAFVGLSLFGSVVIAPLARLAGAPLAPAHPNRQKGIP